MKSINIFTHTCHWRSLLIQAVPYTAHSLSASYGTHLYWVLQGLLSAISQPQVSQTNFNSHLIWYVFNLLSPIVSHSLRVDCTCSVMLFGDSSCLCFSFWHWATAVKVCCYFFLGYLLLGLSLCDHFTTAIIPLFIDEVEWLASVPMVTEGMLSDNVCQQIRDQMWSSCSDWYLRHRSLTVRWPLM